MLKLDGETTKSFLALLRGGNLGVPLVIFVFWRWLFCRCRLRCWIFCYLQHCAGGDGAAGGGVGETTLEFSLFPTILLITTLMRLTLTLLLRAWCCCTGISARARREGD